MIRLRQLAPANLSRLHLVATATLFALGVTAISPISATDGLLRSAIHGKDEQLAAISQRAEQLQAFSRHIRKASLAPEPEIQIPYGGFVRSYKQLEPGSRLTLYHPGSPSRLIQVMSSRKVEPSISLSPAINGGNELVLVSGRLVGSSEAPSIQFLVTVGNQKPLPDGSLDQRTL